MTIPWTACQAGTRIAMDTMLMMGSFSMGASVSWVLCLVQLAQMETGWVVGWTSVLTTALVMSMCSLQRMGNRLGGSGGERQEQGRQNRGRERIRGSGRRGDVRRRGEMRRRGRSGDEEERKGKQLRRRGRRREEERGRREDEKEEGAGRQGGNGGEQFLTRT